MRRARKERVASSLVKGKSGLKAETYDALARDLMALAKGGDMVAARELHYCIAQALESEALTPFLRDLICSMHRSVGDGGPVDAALLTTSPGHRPRNDLRDRRLVELAWALRCYRDGNKIDWTDMHIFETVGSRFGLAAKTVKNIFVRESKKSVETADRMLVAEWVARKGG